MKGELETIRQQLLARNAVRLVDGLGDYGS